jgi:hypothetical protein
MPARRLGLLALVVGVGTALVLTHPLAQHPASTVLDDGTLDCFQFIWNLWWVRVSLVELHTNPFFTRWLFHPDGVSLLFHTLSASLGVASIPLQLVLPGGVVTAHNVLVIAAPAFLLVGTALLAHEVTGDPWAALAAGCLATLTGAIVWFLPIIYLTSTYLAAFVLWAWWRLHRRRRARDVALVLGLLAMLVFAAQEYAMMTLTVLALDTAARLAMPHRLGLARAWGRGTLATWAIVVVGLGALAAVAARNPGAPPPVRQLLLGSAHLSAFVSPPWLGEPGPPFRMVLYLGTAPLLLAVGTAWLGGRRAVFWALITIALLLMACGPFVGLTHPLAAFWPHVPSDIREIPPGHVRGPYYYAFQLVPFLRVFRGAYRWIAVAEIALAVLAATGIAGLRARLAPRARMVVTAIVLATTLVLGLADVRGRTNPAVPATVPAAYAALRDDPEPAAILELPTGLTQEVFSNLSSRWMFYQTAHRKYLLEGTVARLPPGARALVSRQFTTFTDMPWVKYVVIHRDLLGIVFPVARTQLEQVEAVLAAEGAVRVVADGPMEIWRLATFRPDAAR